MRRTLPFALCLALLLPMRTYAQAGTVSPNPGACWRVQFAEWVPALDWNRAGHARDAQSVDRALRHVRDSVFDRDTVAARSQAMVWESTSRGWTLMLYPSWWPAGVSINFGKTAPGQVEMSGDAVALVADAAIKESHSRARVWQVPCG